MTENKPHPRPLDGVKVVELGQLIAGPFAGCILAYFGAEVIKVEPPGKGDPLRLWRVLDEKGTSWWWRSLGRNKKSVTLDLRESEGRELARRLVDEADVLIENFRPGTMEKWGLGPDELKVSNPGLIYVRISGYGQNGPYASRPGFASVCEGVGGFRYINGFPGGPPVRPNLSLGDTLAGLHAALGVLLALIQRYHAPNGGQMVDVAIYEAVFNILEGVVPEYDGAGVVREPSGSTLTGIVPTNTYRCRDGKYVVIGGNADSIFQRLMRAAGRPEMAEDDRFANNTGRVAHEQEIDEAIGTWTKTLDASAVLDKLAAAAVPAGPIYNVEDMMRDPQFQARGLFQTVLVNGKPLKVPAIVPMLSETPGATDWAGPEIGAHNEEILCSRLGLSQSELEQLRNKRII
jgi:crotonobetainyl-CoA:carnitine CoA-transferase CaiB-like acyl-CoA transferase